MATSRQCAEWWSQMNRKEIPDSADFKDWLKRSNLPEPEDYGRNPHGAKAERYWAVMDRLKRAAGGIKKCLAAWNEEPDDEA